nr:unnamed protein product [Callosobruchus chinensis]
MPHLKIHFPGESFKGLGIRLMLTNGKESSYEEDITSGSEYCPSYDEDSEDTEPESDIDHPELSSYYNLKSLMKVKHKVIFDNLIQHANAIENKTKEET